MPVMDGHKATQLIREMKEPKYQQLPIIALSASAPGELETKASKFVMNSFVVKHLIRSNPFQHSKSGKLALVILYNI